MTQGRRFGSRQRSILAGGAAALIASVQMAAAYAQDAATAPTAEAAQKKALDEQALRKATLENEKTEQDLAIAKAKAIADAFPTSPTTGKTTLANDAGKIEASAMTAIALNALAVQIARDARDAAINSAAQPVTVDDNFPCQTLQLGQSAGAGSAASAPILLFSGDEKLTFAHWDKFRFTACRLHGDFLRLNAAARKELGIAETAVPNIPFDPNDAPAGAVDPVTIGAIASVASKLLQFLTPDWDISGVSVAPNDKALAASVAREIVKTAAPKVRVYWSGQVSKLGGSKSVFSALDSIDKEDLAAVELLEGLGKKAKPHQDRLDALAKKKLTPAETKEKAAATAEIARLRKFSTPLTDSRGAYATLVKSLNGPDAEAALPINRVVNEAAAAQLLGGNGIALNVDVDDSGGSVQTSKSIFNLGSGSPPTWVSGGATVNFWAVRPADQQVLASGRLTCIAGNVRLNRVAAYTNGNVNGCAQAQTDRQ